jgi:hypothetical protein
LGDAAGPEHPRRVVDAKRRHHRRYADKLGVDTLDQLVEINDHRARITGFTDGIRTFTQSPYVFTSLRNARLLSNKSDSDITYVLIRLANGQPADAAARALSARMPDVDVLNSREFSNKSRGAASAQHRFCVSGLQSVSNVDGD